MWFHGTITVTVAGDFAIQCHKLSTAPFTTQSTDLFAGLAAGTA
jgi:hypothetical protein